MWSKRGHRGDALEELILLTNSYYQSLGLCRIDKVSTPVKVVDIDAGGMVTKGFFEKKSTVDFIGVAQGVFLAFDAKETHLKSLPMQNIHAHQIEYMRDVDCQGGLAFILVHFIFNDAFFLIPYEQIAAYADSGTRRSIPYKDMDERFAVRRSDFGGYLNYFDALNAYVAHKEELKKKYTTGL
ncbi:MAG: recombination protein [Clostridiales bacterium]|nr:recombination protein [Clostridiales bacterium]